MVLKRSTASTANSEHFCSLKTIRAASVAGRLHGRKTIRPDQLVSEALELLNSMNITALFVVGAGQPVGIVHIYDLLRAGAG